MRLVRFLQIGPLNELLPVFRTGLILNGLGLCKGLVPILHRGQALELFL